MKKNSIYLVCTGNSCRSQMAEGFAKKLYGDDFAVYSGGMFARGIHPLAVKVMEEKGIDISNHTSDSINTELLMRSSVVITLCRKAESSCPVLPAPILSFHWGVEDPSEFSGSEKEVLNKFREVRDIIERKLLDLERILLRTKN